jgi:hypothetical protein
MSIQSTQTTVLPQHLQSHIFAYLHQPYDFERARVITELNERASLIPNDFEHIQFIPSLMMPTKCQWSCLRKKYRTYANSWAVDKCRCGMCRGDLYGNV